MYAEAFATGWSLVQKSSTAYLNKITQLPNEEAMARFGLKRHREKYSFVVYLTTLFQ
jgi:hypothetical protein